MGHSHHDVKNIKAAFFLNLLFSFIEFIGGWYTNSVAIMSDAIHDLGDSLSLGVAWYFQKISHKNKNEAFSYGYNRFSVLGALINGIILTLGSVLIALESIPRLFNPLMPDAQGMIFLSIGGLIFNGIAAYKVSRGHSINEKVVYLHLLEDVLGWAATLLVAIILTFHAIPILDPLLSLAIALFVMFQVFKNLKSSIKIILQTTPDGVNLEDLKNAILKLDHVQDVHDCHVWSMDGNHHVFSTHVVTKKPLQMEELNPIKLEIRALAKMFKISHVTIEFEQKGEC